MKKLEYRPTSAVKQFWFYCGIFYLILNSIMYILISTLNLDSLEKYQGTFNLPLTLGAYFLGMVFFYLLSRGHLACYTEYDEEKMIYHNRLLRKEITFYYKDATSVIFDKRGIKFYDNHEDLVNKAKPLFYVPFFRDGRVYPIPMDEFFKFMKAREEEIGDPDQFKVYRTYKILPGYSKDWRYLSFAYGCLAFLVILNCASPAAVILGMLLSL